jgi:uncharacterized protein (DUF2126 family)
VHSPLIFEIIDRWKKCSIGRCAYYVGSPDGRGYSARPANATEAADRRRQRFKEFDPAPGPMTAPEEHSNPTFPLTLDLRMLPPQQKIVRETALVP